MKNFRLKIKVSLLQTLTLSEAVLILYPSAISLNVTHKKTINKIDGFICTMSAKSSKILWANNNIWRGINFTFIGNGRSITFTH